MVSIVEKTTLSEWQQESCFTVRESLDDPGLPFLTYHLNNYKHSFMELKKHLHSNYSGL